MACVRAGRGLGRTALIGIAVLVVIIAAAAVYLATKPKETPTTPTPAPATPPASPTPSPTPTAPPKPTLTGSFEEDVKAVGRFLEAAGVTTVRYTVWAAGDPNSVMRMYGIVEAAAEINRIWEASGIGVRITIDTYWQDAFIKLYDEFLAAVPRGTNGDFFVNSYVFIPVLAEEGYILDVTEWVKAYWDSVFEDFYAPLMEAAKYKGRYYGVPQDTEARPLYIRRDVAACMGWDLTGLEDKVRNGEFTWSDVYAKAREAVEKGCAKWGLVHRKGSAHPDLIQFIFAFGGRLYDEATGKLVVDKEALYKWFAVEYRFARDGLLPEDIMAWDWAMQIHPTIVGERESTTGNTLFDIGGTWYWTEWQTKKYYEDLATGEKRPLKPEEVKEKFYYTLFPAGEEGKSAVTLSQPFMWIIASNAGKDNPKYEELKDVYQQLAFLLVVGASDAEINAVHSIISAHVPVRRAATALLKDEAWIDKLVKLEIDFTEGTKEKIKDIVARTVHPINVEFLASVGYMLDYTKLAPAHPLYPKLADILKEAIDKVIRGELDPAAGVEYVVSKVKADPDLAGNTVITGEVPAGWEFP